MNDRSHTLQRADDSSGSRKRPTEQDLKSLLDKYIEIQRLRRHREAIPPREAMRALSTHYPGSLRELDQLSDAEIERRIAELQTILSTNGEPLAWMQVVLVWHSEWRNILVSKTEGEPRFRLSQSPQKRAQKRDEVMSRLSKMFHLSEQQVREILFSPRSNHD